MRGLIMAGVAALGLLGASVPAAAFDVARLEGMRTSTAGDVLRHAGYRPATNTRSEGLRWGLWFNDDQHPRCLGVTARDGRISVAQRFDARECGYAGRRGDHY